MKFKSATAALPRAMPQHAAIQADRIKAKIVWLAVFLVFKECRR